MINKTQTYRLFFTALLAHIIFTTNAQKSDMFTSMSFKYINLDPSKEEKKPLPFSAIEIMDARTDTTFFGFRESSSRVFSKLQFKNGLAAQACDFLSSSYDVNKDAEAPKLLLVFRKFWATSLLDTSSATEASIDGRPAILVNAEAYAVYGNEYKPITRIIFNHTVNSINRNNMDEHGSVVLKKCMETILGNAHKVKKTGRLVTLKTIEEATIEHSQPPIISIQLMKKGIYYTYNDFKNNSPAEVNFEVSTGDKDDGVYIIEAGGKPILTRNIWGYCDGKSAYAKMAESYYKLYRSGNTFNVYGSKEIVSDRYVRVGNVLMLGIAAGAIGRQNKKTVYRLDPKPYQLDISTGEFN